MANDFKTKRVAFANFAPTTAATYESDVIIPKGAIVTSIITVEGTTMASGTNAIFKVGTQAISDTVLLAEFTGVDSHDAAAGDGTIVAADGTLNVTTTGTFTGDIDTYVEYYFVEDHT